MIKRFFSFALVCFVLAACQKDKAPNPFDEVVETDPATHTPVVGKVNDAVGGFYVGLPALYSKTSKAYPLIVFLHGAGQYGNGGTADLPLVLKEGIPKLLEEKKFPPNFHVNNKDYSFIVLSPQFSRYPTDGDVMNFIDYAKKKYRIDNARVYLTGISLGGYVSSDMGGRYTSALAAIAPVSGALYEDKMCANIASGKLPVWAFHNNNDLTVSVNTSKTFVAKINSNHPSIAPRLTIFDIPGHDAWTTAYNPDYKEDSFNMYEWMLHYNR